MLYDLTYPALTRILGMSESPLPPCQLKKVPAYEGVMPRRSTRSNNQFKVLNFSQDMVILRACIAPPVLKSQHRSIKQNYLFKSFTLCHWHEVQRRRTSCTAPAQKNFEQRYQVYRHQYACTTSPYMPILQNKVQATEKARPGKNANPKYQVTQHRPTLQPPCSAQLNQRYL